MPAPLTKPCAMPYCGERIKRRMLMCGWHWHMVPQALKSLVFTSLHAWEIEGASVQPYVHAVAQAKLAVAQHEKRSAEEIAALEAEVARYAPGVVPAPTRRHALLQARRRPGTSGICAECGCTELNACTFSGVFGDQPCGWANTEKTLCTNPDCLRSHAAKKGLLP